jgi:hypothetical protein
MYIELPHTTPVCSYPMQQSSTPPVVHNRLIDPKTSVIVDIVAHRRMGKEEMEIMAARALQKLTTEEWPKPGQILTVVTAPEEDMEVGAADYESRWLR